MEVQPKPEFYGQPYASAFQESGVADAYRHRPGYPDEAIEIVISLLVDAPRAVLDVGCGTGFLARRLVDRVDRIDAVDISSPMVERGKRLPGGDHPHLHWITGAVEDSPLNPPYALITAGDSLHWMDWYAVLPRFARMLTPNGYLAILGVENVPPPWEDDIRALIRRYSTVPNWQYFDLVAGLEERGLFRRAGARTTTPVAFEQSIEEYVESFHGRASLPRERLGPANAAAFDEAVRGLVGPVCGGMVELQIVTNVVWGKPLGAPQTI